MDSMQFLFGKLSERMSNFGTIRFLKTESEPNFGFPHIPNCWLVSGCIVNQVAAWCKAMLHYYHQP